MIKKGMTPPGKTNLSRLKAIKEGIPPNITDDSFPNNGHFDRNFDYENGRTKYVWSSNLYHVGKTVMRCD